MCLLMTMDIPSVPKIPIDKNYYENIEKILREVHMNKADVLTSVFISHNELYLCGKFKESISGTFSLGAQISRLVYPFTKGRKGVVRSTARCASTPYLHKVTRVIAELCWEDYAFNLKQTDMFPQIPAFNKLPKYFTEGIEIIYG
jgi:hypothetical protein